MISHNNFLSLLSTVFTNMAGTKSYYLYRIYVPCVEFSHVGLL